MKGKVVGWKGRGNDTVSRKLQLFKGCKGKRNQHVLLPQMRGASHTARPQHVRLARAPTVLVPWRTSRGEALGFMWKTSHK